MINQIFIEVGMALQSKFRFIPILYGDFGFEKRLNTEFSTNEIIILIPDMYLDKHWQRICSLMISRSFVQCSDNVFSFVRNEITVTFDSIENFKSTTGISTNKLPRVTSPFTYYLPSLKQYYSCYSDLLGEFSIDSDRYCKIKGFLSKSELALKSETIKNTKAFIMSVTENEHLKYDYTHYIRVAEMCRKLSCIMGADEFVCVMSALLFDLDTAKTNKYIIEKLLKNEFVSEKELCKIITAINEVKSEKRCKTKESKCLSDACNLDCFGAVGIAMGFADFGKRELPMYPLDALPINNSDDVFRECRDALEYFYNLKQNYEKMFYSDMAKKIAENRIKFMQDFFYRFYDECEGIL